MKTTDYHHQEQEFTAGMTVKHVTDEGDIFQAVIEAIEDGLLHLRFDDGNEGWERPETCFVDEDAADGWNPPVATTYSKSYSGAPFGQKSPLAYVTLMRGEEEVAMIPAGLLRELMEDVGNSNRPVPASGHTPGPWNTERCQFGQWIKAGESFICPLPDHIEHKGQPCGSIASQDKTQDEIDANAKLIATAPELLAALVRLVDIATMTAGHVHYNDMRAARAAISKATSTPT